MQALNAILSRYASMSPLILRVTLGALMLYHGIDKFNAGIGNVSDQFEIWGVPVAAVAAPLTAIIEIVAGAALIAGVFTRVAAALLAAVIVGALIFVKLEGSVLGGSETDFAYLAGFVALMLLGPGPLSVDEAINNDQTVIDVRSSQSTAAAASR